MTKAESQPDKSPGGFSQAAPTPGDSSWPNTSWLIAQNRLLEMIASRVPLDEVLKYLVLCIEAQAPAALGSILLVRDGCLWTGAGPSLPRAFNEAINGAVYGPGEGSCGNTAYTGQPTIVEDIETHPFWAQYKAMALQYGLRSCWSTPILGVNQEVLGTFAIYHRTPQRPTEQDFALIRGATHIAEIALERQRSDDELRRQAEALRDADRRKDVFLAALSHELRNPLAPILTTAQLLECTADNPNPEFLRRGLKVIQSQTRHLTQLIDELLDLSRVAADKIVLQKKPVEGAELVQQALEQMGSVFETYKHKLHINMPSEPIIIYADPVRVVQIIANLLGNAAKYTPQGGEVWLSVSARDDGVEIVIRDSGIGIQPDSLRRIFDLYAQAEQPRPGMHGGLGIGLALVKSLVEKHGGRVKATSEGPGRGSEFRVWLPSSVSEEKVPSPQAASSKAAPRESGRGWRVLLIDDNEDAAQMLGAMLETSGCTVRLGATGKEALAEAEAWDPDVIILDIGLPDLSGHEVARLLRAQSKRRRRLIALTGYGQPSDVALATAAGFDELVTKPADLDTILAAIAK